MARKIVVCAMGFALALAGFVSTPLKAQDSSSSIAGVVRDTSGAVMPGVTVEASSPALIEKVRSVVTDGEGRYNIVDLRSGTYTVTFTLTGFNTFKRDGIELGANFTATVNGEMRVGALEETVTVSGAAPVVDVQNPLQQQVYTRELMDNLPANRNFTRIIAQYPAARVVSDVGGTNGEYLNPGNVHGSATNDTSYELDGMVVTGGYDVGGINNEFYFNNGSMQEITTEVSGMTAESMLGGMHFNAVPKEGSNRFTGTVFANFANNGMQGNNADPDLLARGLRDPNSLDKVWDINPSLGGPILKDKLWFFWGNRWWGTYSAVAGNYYNATPNSFGYKYTPADGTNGRPLKQAQWRQHLRENDLRLTWQAAQKHKISLYYGNEYSDFKDGLTTGGLATANPDAIGSILFQPNYIVQATWSYPATNRLLFEAGGSLMAARYYTVPQPGQETGVYTVLEQSTGYTNQGLTGKSDWWTRNFFTRASASYITGSHAFKAGMTLQQGYPGRDSRTTNAYNYNAMILQLRNGIPNQVTIFTDPIIELENLKANLGLYVQDKWTRNRLTLSGGLRYDYLNGYVPEQFEPAGPWVAARHFDPVYDYPDWKDISPRMGAAYDLFGSGKTAIKASLGRFPLGDGTKGMTAAINPVLSTVNSTARSWTDSNGNFLPDCDLVNPAINGECGPHGTAGFGGVNRLTNFSEDVRTGLNVRPYDWEGSVGINHELTSGLGVGLAYFHRWYGGQTVTRNVLAGPADYDPFCVTAPTDPLLRDVSGQQICGFMNIKPELFGKVNNLIEPASQYGGVDEHFNGVDLNISARLKKGVTINGGMATGKSVWDGCEPLSKGVLPKIYGNIDLLGTAGTPAVNVFNAPSTVFCHQETPWLNQFKIFVVYPLPWEFQVSANFQSTVGPAITAQYPAPAADVAKTLGRPPSGNVATVSVNLINPGTQYDNQQNQLDARFTRTFRVGKTRLQGMVDLYNLLNANPDITLTTAYGPRYLVPTRILSARMVKLGMQLNF